MKDIMIATSNKGKVNEYRQLLEPMGFKVHDLSEIEHVDIIEDGTTFEENALIKARAVYQANQMITIADDSGLQIKALNNEPGIYSARYLEGMPYSYKNQVLVDRLKDKEDRSARFVCAIALIDEEGEHVFTGIMNGSIAHKPEGTNGFGYDPIFIPDGYDKTDGQLPIEVKNEIGHRGQATRKLLEYLNI